MEDFHFMPLSNFEGGNGSVYVKGLHYVCHAGNDRLAGFVEEWLRTGKVQEWEPPAIKVQATGIVR